jgi:pimeloyl-ACP methyl ester carboxylesterase
MQHILTIIGLTYALSAFTQPTTGHAAAIPTATWSAEVVNTNTVPQRALIVKAWFPLSETDKRWPLILLAPGRGMPSLAYTRVSQYLASHGFIVVGIDSPGSGRQSFADGRVVPPDPALTPPPGLMAGPYIEVDQFFASAAQAGASDLGYVLDLIAAADAETSIPFAGRVDTNKVGLLGHSLGGRIAGAFAAKDSRPVAWIGIEGLAPRAARRQGLGIPAMAILSEGVWPYAIENVRELAWCTRHPTYFVNMVDIEHNTIADSDAAGIAAVMPENQLRLAKMIQVFLEYHMTNPNTVLDDWPAGTVVEQHDGPSDQRPADYVCDD